MWRNSFPRMEPRRPAPGLLSPVGDTQMSLTGLSGPRRSAQAVLGNKTVFLKIL